MVPVLRDSIGSVLGVIEDWRTGQCDKNRMVHSVGYALQRGGVDPYCVVRILHWNETAGKEIITLNWIFQLCLYLLGVRIEISVPFPARN